MQIIITKLKKGWQVNNLWKLPKIFKEAITVYRKIENKLSKMKLEAVSIAINYQDTFLNSRRKPIYDNETLESNNREYLLYSLVLFLEDYLKADFVSSRATEYGATQ